MAQSSSNSSLGIQVGGLNKYYDLRPVLSNISFQLQTGNVLGITGQNGSGKSTLVKILANVLERCSGTVQWHKQTISLTDEQLPPHIGFVAPYLQLYTEFTPDEHLTILSQIRGVPHDAEYASNLLDRFGLSKRIHDPLSSFSSGMLQRAKYVLALAHHPAFLFLDEPMTNLDESGAAIIREIVEQEKTKRITVIATNDPDDLSLCSHRLALGAESSS